MWNFYVYEPAVDIVSAFRQAEAKIMAEFDAFMESHPQGMTLGEIVDHFLWDR
jgi:hypothetical protein